MAFGGGVHFCIGAPLSRLESVIALEKIAQRWNTMEVTNAKGDPEEWPLRYEPSFVLRGLASLHLRITC
jgi:cytochrome P450